MPFGVNDAIYGFVIPAIAATAAFVLARRTLPGDIGTRFAPSFALVLGFATGYWLLELGPRVPEGHWHWMPYVLAATVAVGSVSAASSVSHFERLLLYCSAAVVAAWLFVPDWKGLEPSRTIHIIAWTACVLVISILLEPLTSRVSAAVLAPVLVMTLVCGAIILALSGSLRFTQVLGAGAGAMCGMTLVVWLSKRDRSLAGISLSYTVLLAGMLVVGRVNSFSEVPLVSYVLLPFAPLSFWITSIGPLSRLQGTKRALVQIALALAVCAVAVLLAALPELKEPAI